MARYYVRTRGWKRGQVGGPATRPATVAPGSSSVGPLWRALGWGAVAYLGFKVLQALTDEEFGDGEYPARVRRELIDEHIDQRGLWCPECDRRVLETEFTVDHRVALVNGGLTSRWNARVICRSCNSRKGSRNSMWDHVWGRSA